jgi:hypothetical protein
MAGAQASDIYTYGNLKEMYDSDNVYQQFVASSLYSFLRQANKNEVEFDGNHWNQA